MSVLARRLILAFALAGLGFSGASAYVHYKLVTQPNYASPCDVSAALNCTQAYLSEYGSIWGVPVALFGMMWFALVLLIAWFTPPATKGAKLQPGGAYIFALATVGLGVSLYLAYASFVVLRTGCLLCIGTYVSVIGIFLTAGASSASSAARLPSRLGADLRAIAGSQTALIAAVLFIASSAAAIAFFPKETTMRPAAATPQPVAADLVSLFTDAWWKAPRVDLGVSADGAKVVVVKFIDWQCPTCKAAHFGYKPIFDRLAQSHPGQVVQIIKDYPLSNKCNFTISSIGHASACEAAAAARMARDRKKEDAFVDWMFSIPNQQSISAGDLRSTVSKMLGITERDFDREYTAKLDAIKRDIADARALNVNSTPTYYINGVRAQGSDGRGGTNILPAELFDLAIKLELEKPAK
jgi:uncharacterized membrane protein